MNRFIPLLNKKGFSISELLAIIIILGILATLAANLFLNYREKASLVVVKSNLSNAYKASIAYHTENPNGTVTEDILRQYGYTQSENLNLNIVDGLGESLKITATQLYVRGVYAVDQSGLITKHKW